MEEIQVVLRNKHHAKGFSRARRPEMERPTTDATKERLAKLKVGTCAEPIWSYNLK